MSFLKCEACSLLQLIGIAVLIVRWPVCNNGSGGLLCVRGAAVGAEPGVVSTVEDIRNPCAFSFFCKTRLHYWAYTSNFQSSFISVRLIFCSFFKCIKA